jgi:hypothetical protein
MANFVGPPVGTPQTEISSPVPAADETLPPPVRGSAPKAITVGLDFGTHSTKILLRLRNAEKAQLLRIDKPREDYPWFASPSLVRVVDGRVYFGSRALEASGGRLYRSLKVRLLAPDPTDGFDQAFPPGLTPDLLVACYLSWVMGRIRLAIKEYFSHGAPRLFVNVAAPMNHIENASLKSRYLRIVQTAWESVFGESPCPAQQGMPVAQTAHPFASWLEKDVPGRETRQFEVLPESVAPIVSLSLDPRLEPGMYMIVDMGAGTTELSVNHVGEPGADQRVLCYEDESIRFGGDNFDWVERAHREESELTREVSGLVEQFMKTFRRTWCTAYQKDGRNPASRSRWRDFRVLLTGGGARRPGIERAIRLALPMPPWPVGELRYDVTWHEPTDIVLGVDDDSPPSALLAVAHGLSVPRQQWPVFFVPGEVGIQQAPEAIEQPPAYWYVH